MGMCHIIVHMRARTHAHIHTHTHTPYIHTHTPLTHTHTHTHTPHTHTHTHTPPSHTHTHTHTPHTHRQTDWIQGYGVSVKNIQFQRKRQQENDEYLINEQTGNLICFFFLCFFPHFYSSLLLYINLQFDMIVDTLESYSYLL